MCQDEFERYVELYRQELGYSDRWTDAPRLVRSHGTLCTPDAVSELLLRPLTLLSELPDGVADGAVWNPKGSVISEGNVRQVYPSIWALVSEGLNAILGIGPDDAPSVAARSANAAGGVEPARCR